MFVSSAFLLSFVPLPGDNATVGHVVDGDFKGASAVTTADFDGDGRIDIAGAGFYEDSFSWWRNLGANGWERHDIFAINGPFSIGTADIDGDGDSDLYGSSINTSDFGEDTIWWLENQAGASASTPTFLPHFVYTLPNEDPHSVDAGDLDGDGTLDLVVAFVNEPTIHVFRNPSGDGLSLGSDLLEIEIPGVNGVSFVRADDFDRDGDTDIVAATAWDWVGTQNYYWLRNEGPARFSAPIAIAGGLEYNGAFTAAIGDVDGDGLRDLVVSADGAYGNPTVRWIRRIDAAGTQWSNGILVDDHFFGGSGDQGLHVADLDGDGDLDIAGGSYLLYPMTRIWMNQGHGRFKRHDLELGFNAHGITAADLDGDDRLEIIAGAWGGCCYSGEVKYWRIAEQ